MQFEDRYIPEPNSGCFLWLGAVDEDGYGFYWTGKSNCGAHRESWRRTFSDPGKLWVLHKCDTPSCVNPDHLFLGTAADNNRDRKSKNRSARLNGEANGMTPLTNDLVDAIRTDRREQRLIAAEHGVNQSTIQRIKARKTWSHV